MCASARGLLVNSDNGVCVGVTHFETYLLPKTYVTPVFYQLGAHKRLVLRLIYVFRVCLSVCVAALTYVSVQLVVC